MKRVKLKFIYKIVVYKGQKHLSIHYFLLKVFGGTCFFLHNHKTQSGNVICYFAPGITRYKILLRFGALVLSVYCDTRKLVYEYTITMYNNIQDVIGKKVRNILTYHAEFFCYKVTFFARFPLKVQLQDIKFTVIQLVIYVLIPFKIRKLRLRHLVRRISTQ